MFQIIHENTPFKVFNLTVICVSLAAINNNNNDNDNNDNDDNAEEDVGGVGGRGRERERMRERPKPWTYYIWYRVTLDAPITSKLYTFINKQLPLGIHTFIPKSLSFCHLTAPCPLLFVGHGEAGAPLRSWCLPLSVHSSHTPARFHGLPA